MDIEYLKRFVTVGEFLNFRKASDALFISQPALSHCISALEKEVGVPVFVRNTKNVALTPAGEILFSAAKNIIDSYDNALADISKITNVNNTTLKIGYVGAALDNSLTPLLKEFKRQEPDIDVSLTRHRGTEIRELLENHQIQFAVSYEEYTESIPGIQALTLDKEELRLLVNSEDEFAGADSVSIDQITDKPLIICEKKTVPYYYDQVMTLFQTVGTTPNIAQVTHEISDIYRLVDMGVGSAVISYSPKRLFYNSFDLVFVPIRTADSSVLEHNKVIAWEGELSASGRKFIKTVKDYIKSDK